MKKRHKWIIGGFSSIVIMSLIVMAILLNGLILKQSMDYKTLENKIDELLKVKRK